MYPLHWKGYKNLTVIALPPQDPITAATEDSLSSAQADNPGSIAGMPSPHEHIRDENADVLVRDPLEDLLVFSIFSPNDVSKKNINAINS